MNFKTLPVIAVFSCVFFCSCIKKPDSLLSISQIKFNGLENPEGTGAVPDFSWILKANHRGQIQTAYQIIVGSDSDIIRTHPGTIWDSGKILSEESVWIPYQGSSLESAKEYFWRIRVWDEDDKSSSWSKTGKFVTGLFTKKDWSNASWIGYEE